MAIKTPEQLKQLFEETKARKAKERQQKKIQRQKEYYKLCKQADQLLKEAQEQEKKKKMEYLSTLIQKRQEKPLIQVSRRITIYHSNQFVKEPDENDLYQSWEEIKDAERRGEGRLNWNKLQELIKRTKLKINEKKTGKNR